MPTSKLMEKKFTKFCWHYYFHEIHRGIGIPSPKETPTLKNKSYGLWTSRQQ